MKIKMTKDLHESSLITYGMVVRCLYQWLEIFMISTGQHVSSLYKRTPGSVCVSM